MRVIRWYVSGWLGVLRYRGRARRGELWSYYLINQVIIGFTTYLVGDVPATVFGLVQALPLFALAVRRLHDTGREGATLVVVLLPIVGMIMLIVWLVRRGDIGPNRYGSDPRWESLRVPAGSVHG
ncbi:DUF805 domain-containing protein [Virgisporangium aliadipatigenens]|uniref:DUF805 domain-containing protein n=2 Tax=Virgisporangium aliadipatigenens TaxID=741659 RepID=A0A8J3YNE6_9ACTN|nr:DUF805 domain-containing protein [Virgisporangium aliadipatigenens]